MSKKWWSLNIDRFLHRYIKAQESIACRLTNSEDVYELQHRWVVKWDLVRPFNVPEAVALSSARIISPNSFLNVRLILYCLAAQMRWVVTRFAPSARERNGSANWHLDFFAYQFVIVFLNVAVWFYRAKRRSGFTWPTRAPWTSRSEGRTRFPGIPWSTGSTRSTRITRATSGRS